MSNRSLATIVGAIAAILLVYAANPWVQPPEGTIRTLVNVGFWVAAIALAVILFQDRKSAEADEVEIEGPAFARFLFGNSRAGMLWLPIRLFLGFAWLDAGIHKISGATGSGPPRFPSRAGRRSPTSGTATSSTRSSPAATRRGSRG